MIFTSEQLREFTRAGVYVLYLRGAVVYVGMSINFIKRITAHIGDKEFDEVRLYPIDKDENYIRRIESELIILYRPRLNKGQPGEVANASLLEVIKCPYLPDEIRNAARAKRKAWLPIVHQRFPQLMYASRPVASERVRIDKIRMPSKRYRYEDYHGNESRRNGPVGEGPRMSRESEGR